MKILTAITVFSIAAITSTHSHALSCASTGFNLESIVKANKAAGKNVVYVMGSFSGKQNKPTKSTSKPVAGNSGLLVANFPKSATSNLVFSGKVMTKNGAKPFKQKVKVTASCTASWCGKVPKSGQKTIAALTKTSSGYTMAADPCGPNTFSRQVNEDWKKLKRLVR